MLNTNATSNDKPMKMYKCYIQIVTQIATPNVHVSKTAITNAKNAKPNLKYPVTC